MSEFKMGEHVIKRNGKYWNFPLEAINSNKDITTVKFKGLKLMLDTTTLRNATPEEIKAGHRL